MSRTRMLKPEFFSSRSLSKVSRDARLLFQGLWCEADSAGRGKADPRIVKGAVFPLDDDVTLDTVHDWLCELHDTGHILLYEVDEEPLFEVLNFSKHQAASYRTGEPKHPGPDDPKAIHATCTTDRAVCTPRRALREGKGKEENVHSGTTSTKPDPLFDEFWTTYPNKVNKQKARTSWNRLTDADKAAALRALPDHIGTWKDPNFIPHPTTWLNGRRWEDEIKPKHTGARLVGGIYVEPGVDL